MIILDLIASNISSGFLLVVNGFAVFLMIFYFIYNLKNSKHKLEYLKTHRVKTVIFSISLLLVSYVVANLMFESKIVPVEEQEKIPKVYTYKEAKEKLKKTIIENKRLFFVRLKDTLTKVNVNQLFDKNILNSDTHYVYLNQHFKLPEKVINENSEIFFVRDDFTVFNRFVDMTRYSEQAYIDEGYFGTGVYLMLKKEFKAAVDSILKIKNTNNKYYNIVLAQSYDSLNNKYKAIEYYEKSLNTNTIYPIDNIHSRLVYLYKYTDSNDKLKAYINDPELSHFVNYSLAKSTLLHSWNIFNYYHYVLKYNFANTNKLGIVSAIAICFIWIMFLYSLDIFEKEKFKNILFVTFSGALFALFTYFLGDITSLITTIDRSNLLLDYIVNVGLVEEIIKITPFLILLNYSKSINEPFDFILYASLSALGFSTLENILYFDENKSVVIFVRALLCSTGHMTFSSIIAYGMVKASLFNKKLIWRNFILYWLLASVLHGFYDFLLTINFLFGAELLFISCVTIWFVFINNTLNFSKHFTYQTKVNVDSRIIFLGVGLTGILVLEYFINIYRIGIDEANDSLFISIFSSCSIIIFLIYKISNLDLIKQYWRPIKLSSGKNLANPWNIFVIIIRFFLGNHIAAQNFVNKSIIISPFWNNSILSDLMPEPIEGIIRDRIIMQTKNENGIVTSDASWFIVKMKKDLQLQEYNTNYLLIKFKHEIENLNVDDDNDALLSLINDYTLFQDNKIDRDNTTPFGYVTVNELSIKNEGILKKV